MKTPALYRLEVAPLIILPLGRSPFFSYASTLALPKGSLVAISFGKREIEGVVYSCQSLPGPKPTWMKSITKLLAASFLTEKQCALAEYIGKEYFTPLGKTLQHFIPKKARARKTPPPRSPVSLSAPCYSRRNTSHKKSKRKRARPSPVP